MKSLLILITLGIFWGGRCALGLSLTQDDNVGRKLMMVAGKEEAGQPYVVAIVFNDTVTCSAVVIKEGYALTHKDCGLTEGDAGAVVLCATLNEDLKTCSENGSKIEVSSITTGDAIIIGIVSDITPAQISQDAPKEKDACTLVGFGKVGAAPEALMSPKPLGAPAIITLAEDNNVTVEAQEASAICTGDMGGAIICNDLVQAIIPKEGTCEPAPFIAPTIKSLWSFIEANTQGGGNDSDNATGDDAQVIGTNFIMMVLPTIIVMLMFPSNL